VRERDITRNTTCPAELMATFTSDMVTLLLGFISATIRAPLGTRFPTQSQCASPCLLFVVLLLFFPFQLLLPLLARDARMRPRIAFCTEHVPTCTLQLCIVIRVIYEDTLFTSQMPTIINMWVVSCKKLKQFVVAFLCEAFLKNVNVLF